MTTPVQAAGEGVCHLYVRATPGAKADKIKGIAVDADGQSRLLLAVSAVADKDKANKALIKLIARSFDLPKSHIRLIRGNRDRYKCFELQADYALLADRIASYSGK